MAEICPLCDRPLGQKIEKHHVVPKSKGGRETVSIHPICHRKIHKVFTNTELANLGSIEALKKHPDIAAFTKWLKRKPPDFYRRTR
jgi:5-methylcytosine-specific restriction endonuclease McrA